MAVRSLAGRQAEMTKGVWEKVPNFSALLLVFAFRRGIIAAKQLSYRSYGQDDVQAEPAPIPMAKDITSLRDCDIIVTGTPLYWGMVQPVRALYAFDRIKKPYTQ